MTLGISYPDNVQLVSPNHPSPLLAWENAQPYSCEEYSGLTQSRLPQYSCWESWAILETQAAHTAAYFGLPISLLPFTWHTAISVAPGQDGRFFSTFSSSSQILFPLPKTFYTSCPLGQFLLLLDLVILHLLDVAFPDHQSAIKVCAVAITCSNIYHCAF